MIINLTPHTISVEGFDGSFTNLPPSGAVARVAVSYSPNGGVGPLPVFRAEYGEVEDLPSPEKGVYLVVSGMVAAAAPRSDVFSPGELIRDESGKPIGCRGLKSTQS
jgi:hypothetical protein